MNKVRTMSLKVNLAEFNRRQNNRNTKKQSLIFFLFLKRKYLRIFKLLYKNVHVILAFTPFACGHTCTLTRLQNIKHNDKEKKQTNCTKNLPQSPHKDQNANKHHIFDKLMFDKTGEFDKFF